MVKAISEKNDYQIVTYLDSYGSMKRYFDENA